MLSDKQAVKTVNHNFICSFLHSESLICWLFSDPQNLVILNFRIHSKFHMLVCCFS